MDLIRYDPALGEETSCVTAPDGSGLGSSCCLLPECTILGILAGNVETFVDK